jgi:uncharacterized repeat protein (TIGR01451 family)
MSRDSDRRAKNQQVIRIFSVAVLAIAGSLALLVGAVAGAPAPSGTADLSLTKSDSPDPVSTGAPLAYTIQVTNAGPDVAANVVVTDNLPKGVGFVSAQSTQGSCGVSGNRRKVTCTLGRVAVNVGPQYTPTPVTVTINVLAPSKVGKGGTISNTASVKSDTKDPKQSNNTATATTRVLAPPAVTCHGHPATIVGTPGADLLTGSPGNDVIFAGAGNDRIVSSSGSDLICAGAGSDVIRSGGQPDRVFAGPGADRILGGAGGDVLRGGRGPDRIRGDRGPDLLIGGPGRDRCSGGPGRDLLRSC